MSTETTSAVELVTRRLPTSSRIWPRTAGTITFLVWLARRRNGRLARCLNGDDRPSGADRPKSEPPASGDEERLNTEPPSRDRPRLERPNLAPWPASRGKPPPACGRRGPPMLEPLR